MKTTLGRTAPWLIALATIGLGANGCNQESGESPGDDPPLADVEVLLKGAPDKADLVDEKTDQIPPAKFDLMQYQSPVRNQASRGVCSIFATVALMEHLYVKQGTYKTPDFSEQYLQWSVKNEVGDFTNTEGSSAESNLRAISDFGIVEEAAWPYETSPWSAANDAACTGGENLPLKCYTNGEPPQTAKDAKKWKLPASRWLSSKANSIKAFMVNKNQGVIVGGTFFYQAWNHGRSTLPIRSDYMGKGYILAPNAKDREESLKKRAGHAFLLIGWDDDLEIQATDEKGQPAVGADGKPVMQKGFFLFKNSWGTGRFGVQNPKGAGYGWIQYKYVEELSAVAADLPKVDAPTMPEVCNNALDDDGDGKVDCADADCSANAACKGDRLQFDNATAAPIPDASPAGVESTIDVSLDAVISAMDLTVDISHTYRGDLEIRLAHPDGADTQILAKTSNSGDDVKETFPVAAFNGKRTKGTWKLKVIDHSAQDTGTLNRWSLRFQGGTDGQKVTVGDCRLAGPAKLDGKAGQKLEVKGQLTAAGVTTKTPGNDAHPSLVGQIGLGPRGSAPGAGWTWTVAAPTVGWNDSAKPGWDEYAASLTAPSTAGGFDYAARFSGDGGQTWTLCDLDGAANGYQPAQAGALTVQPSANGGALLISEYLEGSASNKAVEIANLGAAAATLDGCQLRVYLNGAASPSRSLYLSGMLAPRGTLVVCHPSSSAALLAKCQKKDTAFSAFNGNDAIDLVCGGQVLDVFGRIGENPGTAWGSGATSTVDHTLRRKCAVTAGRASGATAFDPAIEWDGFAKDAIDGLGAHCN